MTMKRISINVQNELHKEIRLTAHFKEMTVQELVTRLLTQYVKENLPAELHGQTRRI